MTHIMVSPKARNRNCEFLASSGPDLRSPLIFFASGNSFMMSSHPDLFLTVLSPLTHIHAFVVSGGAAECLCVIGRERCTFYAFGISCDSQALSLCPFFHPVQLGWRMGACCKWLQVVCNSSFPKLTVYLSSQQHITCIKCEKVIEIDWLLLLRLL